ncbi:MAG: hypothetical protein R3C43_19155 [Chloroflexota bacterium]
MATTNSYQVSRAQWLVDWANSPRDLGHQIDWASVDPARVDASGGKYVPDGTIMAKLASGKIIPRRDVVLEEGNALGTETAAGILIGQANEGDKSDALTGYGLLLGGVVYNNLLHDFGHADLATWKTELETNALTFVYLTHVNSAAS